MPPTSFTLTDALANSPAASLLAQLEQTRAIMRLIAPALTALSAGLDPTRPDCAAIVDNNLVLFASSAAQAAKLRQGFPSLLRLLHTQGVQVYEIRVRVQPKHTTYPEGGSSTGLPHVIPSPRLSRTELAAPLAFTEKLALTLPDSPLREAIQRLSTALVRLRDSAQA